MNKNEEKSNGTLHLRTNWKNQNISHAKSVLFSFSEWDYPAYSYLWFIFIFELLRYIRALKTTLRERCSKRGINVPTLCSCHSTIWDADPMTCSQNCSFYRNPTGNLFFKFAYLIINLFSFCNITSQFTYIMSSHKLKEYVCVVVCFLLKRMMINSY
jgi:hypothetical protein